MAFAITPLVILCIQGVLSNTAISQFPAVDETCPAGADYSTLLQSRVQIAHNEADDNDGQDGQEFNGNNNEGLEWPSWNGPSWNDVKKAANRAKKKAAEAYEKTEAARKAAEKAFNKAKEMVDKPLNNLIKKATKVVEEAVDQPLAITNEALLSVQHASVKWTDQAWKDVQKEAQDAADAAAAEAAAMGKALLGPLAKCIDIKKLVMDVFLGVGGQAKSFIDKEKSKIEVSLSETPTFSASLKTSLGKLLSLEEEPSFEQAMLQAHGQGISLSQAMSQSELVSNAGKKVEWEFGPKKYGDFQQSLPAPRFPSIQR